MQEAVADACFASGRCCASAVAPTNESDSMADFIEGKRPVIEALRTHVPLKYILMADNLSQGDSIVRDIQRKAKNLDVPIKKVSKKKLDEISERGSHQPPSAT